jgi:hypothetical protein
LHLVVLSLLLYYHTSLEFRHFPDFLHRQTFPSARSTAGLLHTDTASSRPSYYSCSVQDIKYAHYISVGILNSVLTYRPPPEALLSLLNLYALSYSVYHHKFILLCAVLLSVVSYCVTGCTE